MGRKHEKMQGVGLFLMKQYLVELHNVPHELTLYRSELSQYGTITYCTDYMPTYVWVDSPWDIDVIMDYFGVKKVHLKRNYKQISVLDEGG